MATCKTVWFCESDPERWFEKSSDAEKFDKVAEIKGWVGEEFHSDFAPISLTIARIMERYEIKQRWDWKAPDQDEQK